jgi:hypothetical protein
MPTLTTDSEEVDIKAERKAARKAARKATRKAERRAEKHASKIDGSQLPAAKRAKHGTATITENVENDDEKGGKAGISAHPDPNADVAIKAYLEANEIVIHEDGLPPPCLEFQSAPFPAALVRVLCGQPKFTAPSAVQASTWSVIASFFVFVFLDVDKNAVSHGNLTSSLLPLRR